MGEERKLVGACPHDCPDTCSMLVTVKDGKVTSVRGNPEQPFTRGRLCIKVNNYQDRVHSEERILYPLRRIGPKGAGEFEKVSWDEALSEIGSRWRGLVEEFGAQSILPYSYLGTQGILNGLNVGDPFFNKLGATIGERTFCDSGACTAYEMTVGHTAAVDPESIVHSKYIILWACNALSTNSHLWPFIEKARKNGAALVVIDPVKTKTARLADWHISIRPGTDAALALSIMNVVINEGLVDQDYVDRYTYGYEELKVRAAEYDPEKVENITGIPADDIRTLARAYAQSAPAMIRIGVAIERHAGGGQAVRAITSLPALVGSWRKPGGGLLQLPLWAFPVNFAKMMRPDFIGNDVRVLNLWKLGQILCDDESLAPPIKSLFVYNSNPVVTTPEQDKVIKGLQREDLFTVVSEQFLTDTTLYADIVLPATTQVEQEDIMFSWGHFYLSYNNQSIAPLGDAVSNTELFRRLAKTMNFDDPFFYRSDELMIDESMLWDEPALEGISLDELKLHGFARLNLDTADRYAPHAEGNFPTPSGKCEFKTSLAESGNFVNPLFRQGYAGQQSGEPVDPLPHYIPPRESPKTNSSLAKDYPLNLISPKSHAFITSNYGNMPYQIHHAGEQTVLINPEDAGARRIESGRAICISSRIGEFTAVAVVTADTMPGLVVAPVGYWRHTSQGNATVQSIMSSDYADLGAAPTFSDVLVEIKAV
ncbi:molybdopterin oxidoreductase family protein [Halieaceae bacterium IMCC8485]|uniref:Molybdopterin oxidoreductase family protein n=1 Tax=Candidatus Seongchinamella marina TaxID=2518990 RepID=A0ABT3SZJ7_9GAMM|nr:molybdopterin-dependent oxidoreductase [Candidatus Seongchinamella marina]MCX2975430.1 molybdopterin oxidoreductase family protein [Candidatus Seongchinamella marina]